MEEEKTVSSEQLIPEIVRLRDEILRYGFVPNITCDLCAGVGGKYEKVEKICPSCPAGERLMCKLCDVAVHRRPVKKTHTIYDFNLSSL